MKHLFASIVVIAGLIILFIVFHRPDIQTAHPETDRTPAMTETKPEPQSVFELKREGSLPSAASVTKKGERQDVQPVGCDDEKTQQKKKKLESGFKCIQHELFKNMTYVIIPRGKIDLIVKKGYDKNRFMKMPFLYTWNIDYDNLPEDVNIKNEGNGMRVESPKGKMRILAQKINGMGRSFFFEIVVQNNSREGESTFEFGIEDSGQQKKGYTSLRVDAIPAGKKSVLQYEISMYDYYTNFSPVLSVSGDVTINEFNVYRYDHQNVTLVDGTIQERSALPDPRQTDYPDCRYTARFEGHSILEGLPCNKEIVLSIDGFIDKKTLPSNELKEGDKLKCAIVRFDMLPDEMARIQEADDLALFGLDSYLLISYETVASFADALGDAPVVEFSDSSETKQDYVSIFDRKLNPEMQTVLKQNQKDAIEQDRRAIDQKLSGYSEEKKQMLNQRFLEVWDKEKSKDQPEVNRARGCVWRNMNGSFYALPEEFMLIEDYPLVEQHNIEALIAFKDYLETQGIQLLVSLVPDYYDIAARVINEEFRNVPDFRAAIIAKQLLDNGIEATYISDEIIHDYNKYPFAFLYPIDAHPGDISQDVSCRLVAEKISRFRFPRQMEDKDFSIKQMSFSYMQPPNNYLYPPDCDIGNNVAGETYLCNKILYQDKEIGRDYTDSPVFVLSNSFADTPSGTAFSDYLSMKTGIRNHTYVVTGNAVLSTAFQRIFAHPEKYLKDKKILILHLGVRHLLGANILNFRELDALKQIENNLKLLKTEKVNGNENSIPAFAVKLSNPSVFEIGEAGKATILDLATTGLDADYDKTKSLHVVVNYCCRTEDKLSLSCNATTKHLSGTYSSYGALSQVFFSVPPETKQITVDVLGKPGALIAIQSVQLYQ